MKKDDPRFIDAICRLIKTTENIKTDLNLSLINAEKAASVCLNAKLINASDLDRVLKASRKMELAFESVIEKINQYGVRR